MKYAVWVPEVWVQEISIEADSPEEAMKLVKNGDGIYLDDRLDYSHTLDEGWDIQEA